jgi:hypothetical protein
MHAFIALVQALACKMVLTILSKGEPRLWAEWLSVVDAGPASLVIVHDASHFVYDS